MIRALRRLILFVLAPLLLLLAILLLWLWPRYDWLPNPHVFDDGDALYLLYTGAAEQAIGLARLLPSR